MERSAPLRQVSEHSQDCSETTPRLTEDEFLGFKPLPHGRVAVTNEMIEEIGE